jgi:predicted AAA+ superfamily ATPase
LSNEDKAIFLETYVHSYLREEILEEQLIRKVEPFNAFLEVVAQTNGDIINYSSIADDIGANYNSTKTYFEILEDTLIGFKLPAYARSIRKRQGQKPKFYLFDTGVKRALDNTLRSTLPISGKDFGRLFESFIVNECFKLNSYLKRSFKFSFLRVDEALEIDLIIETPNRKAILVEIKASDNVNDRHIANILHFSKDFPDCEMYCLSRDPTARTVNGVQLMFWKDGLRKIFIL